MTGGLASIRLACTCPADAIRWACVLEATAPKAGNVYPGRDFEDLSYLDFVTAAELAASAFDPRPSSFSHGVLEACGRTAERLGTNVNLGILLLLGPLVQTDAAAGESPLNRAQWRDRVVACLDSLTAEDADRLYAAINVAAPGGMGQSDEMDLSGPPPEDFLAAMRHAVSRDRIAKNYADGFADFFHHVVPLVHQSLIDEGDWMGGLTLAHLRLLAAAPDTLIARKFGEDVAREVQRRARFDHRDGEQREAFDRYLRTGTLDRQGQSSRINPGTTADLIAAAVYVLLREAV
ncbi:ATP:dephospho-CoA triphosphoribosyl transferase [Stieleria maiorica]|uniref:ATP:dephospho-CoA triphosphoribosyl transferase n=1 Tax=Stieleria maiorica TaxID=2795974 RepID=A0A5B9M8Z5_9BACT|nr:triphosphoribosyl-dephospho-CoA synthase [Stieleria maiorica]QEF97133.1 ATP:dephospho-CoA triphosphoribosyl transferase [Stieleria maiorica]